MKPSDRLQIELNSKSEAYIRNHNLKWYKKIYVDREIVPRDNSKGKDIFILGRLYTFLYDDPKYKDELIFYSAMPISLFIGYSKNAPENPMMVNMHFIPPQIRKAIFDRIYLDNRSKINSIEKSVEKNRNNDRELSTTYYDLQKSLIKSGYGFAIRSYIVERIKTEPLIISYNDWWRILTFANQNLMKKSVMEIYKMYKLKLDSDWKPFTKEKPIKLK